MTTKPCDVSGDEIVIECDLPAPPAKVWRALTVPELLAAWLLSDDMRPLTDAPAAPQDRDGHGPRQSGGSTTSLELLDAEPHRTLRYRWTAQQSDGGREQLLQSVLSFELTPAAGGTHLRVVHGSFLESANLRMMGRTEARELGPVLPLRKRPVALASRRTGAPAGSQRPAWGADQGPAPWTLRRAA